MSAIKASQVVTVGIDGSAEAQQAADWALAYAESRGAPVRLVTAVEWPIKAQPFSPYAARETLPGLRDAARGANDDAVTQALMSHPRATVTGALSADTPIQTLLTASHDSDLLVLGERGLNAFERTIFGSVAAAVVAHATCPTVVVRGPRLPGADAPVVAGLDGSAHDDATLALAFDLADRFGAPLVAVHAYGIGPVIEGDDPARRRAEALAMVDSALHQWAPKYPQVQTHSTVERDRPAAALVKLGRTAGLLVVGAHGRGGFPGMLLGSVAEHVAERATCPVVVVHP